MPLLEISQIVFNLTVSFAIIIITALFGIIAYDIIRLIKGIKKFSNDLNQESTKLYKNLNNFLEGISKLSFISWLLRKKDGKNKTDR
ncbi:MAG: hypothetical protein UR46_C0021G0007 [Parcubacteria group bacterium GW2011_GWA1_33_6]|uniref:Uncharacterized protein n=1 Tax=Candidatus Staskawiczbacteria bacterium RIFCSPHIGHO2_02_FULL_33_16 TaxID=1802204 RepID=A0A1G2HZQ9_9BACT|nr:MAG: hypothetical protein UR31_C0012G0007 [Parcubacteria group bacterium GW2011_GWA2_33_14]KKP54450.1 MAG: hypothetical protein UR46_C0021G0007 [Parcubacteria group bacterium GW2011_GWA1_33_6]OGZ67308.1 MAG: hypothetical protein A3D34_00900 [Candidatus Staskawiczbacteria bacterium RIFCSPHIGHO2_02_FULL_33_16]OGZ70481.1 MAG: hypothetical protein A2980_00825 [Candidatus Staskawiczbacteria bacterium RIFCSPLOWO2_01_FULL_33_13]